MEERLVNVWIIEIYRKLPKIDRWFSQIAGVRFSEEAAHEYRREVAARMGYECDHPPGYNYDENAYQFYKDGKIENDIWINMTVRCAPLSSAILEKNYDAVRPSDIVDIVPDQASVD